MVKNGARRKETALWISLGVPLSLIIALAIGLISFLNFYVFQKTYKDLNVARLSVVARDLRQTIEDGLNLGLTPQANTQLGGFVASLKQTTEGLRFAAIINEKGARLNEVGDALPEQDWAKRLDGNPWMGEDVQSYQVGLPFRNSFGVVVGAVIIGYDKAALEVAVSAMRNSLITDWLYAVAAVLASMLFGVWWLTRRLQLDLDKAERMLERTFEEVPFGLSLPTLGDEIERSLPDFIRKSRNTSEELSRSLECVSKS